jgi:hypothetical protein
VKEINKKIRDIERNVLVFLFKIISPYFDACVALHKKFLKTVSKGLQKNSVQFDRHVLLIAFSIMASPFFEGIICVRKMKT